LILTRQGILLSSIHSSSTVQAFHRTRRRVHSTTALNPMEAVWPQAPAHQEPGKGRKKPAAPIQIGCGRFSSVIASDDRNQGSLAAMTEDREDFRKPEKKPCSRPRRPHISPVLPSQPYDHIWSRRNSQTPRLLVQGIPEHLYRDRHGPFPLHWQI
jgi:hypothetical protein